jgi:DNA-directed RNA polymerase
MPDQQLNGGPQLDLPGYEDQVSLESWCRSTGAGRILSGKWHKGAAGALGSHLCRRYLEEVLKTYRKSRTSPGRQAIIWSLMHSEESVVQVALEAFFWLLGNLHEEQTYNTVCSQLGKRAEYTLWLTHPIWRNSAHIKGLRLASNGDMGMNLIAKRLRDGGFRKAALYKPLSKVERIAMGAFFVECVCQCTHLIDVFLQRKGKKTVRMVRHTQLYWDFLKRWKENVMLFRPLHMPMVIPPRPYTEALEGGYYTLRSPVSTVPAELYHRQFRKAKPGVLGALNVLQQQAYQLDHGQMALERKAWELGHEVGGLPRRERMASPSDQEYKREGLGPSAYWKAHWQWRADQRKDAQRSRFVNCLIGYERIKEFKNLYLVHHLDHRGRIYARGSQLNIQGGEVYRTLFQFAEKAPMRGSEKEFAWSLGEAMGLPPSHEIRQDYLREYSPAIRRVGEEPLDHVSFWAEQKEPWRFIQLCRDWAGYLADPGYVTGTIHWLDQTSSGYCHAACLLGDEQLARFTNVIGSKPADLYVGAGKATEMRLKAKLEEEEDPKGQILIRWWLDHRPGRKLWKQAFMPLVYGRSYLSLSEVITAYLKDNQENFLTDEGIRILDLAKCLASVVHEVGKEIMPSVMGLQKWLGEAAKLQIDAGYRPHWYTPDGLMVESYSSDSSLDWIQLSLANRKVRLVCQNDEGAPINKRKSISGLGAHFVHSQDAAFLRKFVSHWSTYQHPISTVHDCFGTTVDKAGMLRSELNDQWARFYSIDYLTYYQGFVQALTGKTMPPPPRVGNLDRNKIGENPFLFC